MLKEVSTSRDQLAQKMLDGYQFVETYDLFDCEVCLKKEIKVPDKFLTRKENPDFFVTENDIIF